MGRWPLDVTIRYGHPLIVEDGSQNDTRPYLVLLQHSAQKKRLWSVLRDAEHELAKLLLYNPKDPPRFKQEWLQEAVWCMQHASRIWPTYCRTVRRMKLFRPDYHGRHWTDEIAGFEVLEARLAEVRRVVHWLVLGGLPPHNNRPMPVWTYEARRREVRYVV